MLLGVRGARDVLRRDPATAEQTLEAVEAGGERSVAELRRVFALLREPADTRPQPALTDLPALVGEHRAAGLDARLVVCAPAPPLPAGVELSAYRIVQEALTNVRRHAGTAAVTVTVAYGAGALDLEVRDDGAAAAPDRHAGDGHGLVGMRERVALLGGRLEAGPVAGGGFRVAAHLPAEAGR
jgi:signal transduction histidine kinase